MKLNKCMLEKIKEVLNIDEYNGIYYVNIPCYDNVYLSSPLRIDGLLICNPSVDYYNELTTRQFDPIKYPSHFNYLYSEVLKKFDNEIHLNIINEDDKYYANIIMHGNDEMGDFEEVFVETNFPSDTENEAAVKAILLALTDYTEDSSNVESNRR